MIGYLVNFKEREMTTASEILDQSRNNLPKLQEMVKDVENWTSIDFSQDPPHYECQFKDRSKLIHNGREADLVVDGCLRGCWVSNGCNCKQENVNIRVMKC